MKNFDDISFKSLLNVIVLEHDSLLLSSTPAMHMDITCTLLTDFKNEISLNGKMETLFHLGLLAICL